MKYSERLILERYESLYDLKDTYRQWMDAQTKDKVFCSYYWFCLLEKNIFKEQVVVYVVKDLEGKLLLILPCYESRTNGLELHSLTNYYSVYYSPVIAADINQVAIFNFLFRALKVYKYRLISFQAMDEQSDEWQSILRALKASYYYVRPAFSFGNRFERLYKRTFDEYWQKRPSRLKNTIRRKSKKLSDCDCDIVIKSDCSDINKILQDYWQVYNNSWKQAEPYPEFIDNMVRYFCQQQMLRVGVAYLNNQPVAAQIWFVYNQKVDGRVAAIYKLAYDEQYKLTSIGSILTKALFENSITKDKVSIIDYLSGDDAYKVEWVGERRERWGFLAYNLKTYAGFTLLTKKIISKFLKRRT